MQDDAQRRGTDLYGDTSIKMAMAYEKHMKRINRQYYLGAAACIGGGVAVGMLAVAFAQEQFWAMFMR